MPAFQETWRSNFASLLCRRCVPWSQPFLQLGQAPFGVCADDFSGAPGAYETGGINHQNYRIIMNYGWFIIALLTSKMFRILSGWQAVRGLLQSVSLEDTEDCGNSLCGRSRNMCKPRAATAQMVRWPQEELRLAAIQALKEAVQSSQWVHVTWTYRWTTSQTNIGNAFETESASNLYICFESVGPGDKSVGSKRRLADGMPGMKPCLWLRDCRLHFVTSYEPHIIFVQIGVFICTYILAYLWMSMDIYGYLWIF